MNVEKCIFLNSDSFEIPRFVADSFKRTQISDESAQQVLVCNSVNSKTGEESPIKSVFYFTHKYLYKYEYVHNLTKPYCNSIIIFPIKSIIAFFIETSNMGILTELNYHVKIIIPEQQIVIPCVTFELAENVMSLLKNLINSQKK